MPRALHFTCSLCCFGILFLLLLLCSTSSAFSSNNTTRMHHRKQLSSTSCTFFRPVRCGTGVCCRPGQACSADGTSCLGCPSSRPIACPADPAANEESYCCPTGHVCSGGGLCVREDGGGTSPFGFVSNPDTDTDSDEEGGEGGEGGNDDNDGNGEVGEGGKGGISGGVEALEGIGLELARVLFN